jgi:hypothetical protein
LVRRPLFGLWCQSRMIDDDYVDDDNDDDECGVIGGKRIENGN